MPDSVIKTVEVYAKSTALPGIFDFADRNGILFEWNEEVDESPKGIVEVQDIILYPSLATEHPGVALGRDQPLPLIKEELVPQGHAEDAAACNATFSHSTSQEWGLCYHSYTPTWTNLTTTKVMTTTAS
jgi:hypothetical protein